MSIQEQKLFFTRNGNYTLWEKLQHLKAEENHQLYLYVLEKELTNVAPRNADEYSNFFFKIYEQEDAGNRTLLEEKINEIFTSLPSPKSDFNALIYRYIGKVVNPQRIIENISNLIAEKDSIFKIDGLSIQYNFYTQNKPNATSILDFRFTHKNSLLYKGNNNDQFTHTEIRFYLNYNFALVTNYSGYTHTDNQKYNFVQEVLKSIIDNHTANLSIGKLEDHSLRSILLAYKATPSKLKFKIEGRMEIGVDINQVITAQEVLKQEEVKSLYNKYPISHIKVTISEEENKYLLINGLEGKLLSRAKTIEPSDIDLFIEQLIQLLKFDYINKNYYKELSSMARQSMTSTSSSIEVKLRKCLQEIENKVQKTCQDSTSMFTKTIINAFFYCIIKKITLAKPTEADSIQIAIHSQALNMLALISTMSNTIILNNLAALIYLLEQHSNDFPQFLQKIDEEINSTGCASNVIGA
ncbi:MULTISPECIES: chromosome partitioning protein ParB [Bacillus cereus group]|uniref:chromosome partitioning protein ParB n=1 Tax=Bacillus cereus group TaxID=86661 RepID=UPI000BF421C6|nr:MULTISPECIES: chromosome partitioning protein ParB [Bacillus cereus group]PFS73876.1 chromosome partitioning protein ParB [Bacillus thuringiensis]